MENKVLLAYVIIDIVFALTGALMIGFSVIVQNTMFTAPNDGQNAVINLLYQQFPLTAGIVNGVFILATFALSLPAIATPSRGWLKGAGYMTVVCSIFSLVVGLYLWILTLRTKETFFPVYAGSSVDIQKLMQSSFQCCGYFNSTTPAFQTDQICTSPASAALITGCSTPITTFANVYLDEFFTAVFGFVGVDGVLIMATACLLKERKERERFRHIDEKTTAIGKF